MASSLRAAGVTGAGPEVPGAKVMPTILGERAWGKRSGAAGRAVLVGEVAAVPVEVGGTDGAATTRELPSVDDSVSLVGDPVADVKLPSPSVPLVLSESVVWPSMAMWDAAPSCSGATVPPHDDADAHKIRESTKRGGETEEEQVECMAYRYRWRTIQTQLPPAQRRALGLCRCNSWDVAYMAMVDICTHGCHRGIYTCTWHYTAVG
ncbi:hypothetical protein NDU88_000708 [Pleurodeles waltl]|uniref:Uncharacterized protein n=1 Tax=Pleurodeles waltl TaxID=8319 RepID=A0AAV7VVI2_PLEWA|nr:hypothetical protein NDU88_000708 [Pleurodeles waltl]